MAEGRFDVQPTPEKTNLKDRNMRRNSTGTRKTSTPDGGEKIIPHYLRASTGSCHDLCKHGRNRAFEEIEKHPIQRGNRVKMVEKQKPEKNLTLVDKKPLFKPKLSSGKTPETIKKETTHVKKVDVSAKPSSSSRSKPMTEKSSALRSKPVAEKPSSSPLSYSESVTGRRNGSVKTGSVSGAPKIGRKKALVLPKASVSPRLVTRVAGLNTKYKGLKASSSPLKTQMVTKDESKSKLPSDEKVREKTLYIVEPKPEDESLIPSSTFPSRETEVEEEHHEGDGEEEYVDSDYTIDEENEMLSESDETINVNQLETSTEEYKRGARKRIQDEDMKLAEKLNFRNGKVVDLRPENDGARKLKFNRGRVLGNNQNVENATRRRFRRREVDGGDTKNGGREPENIILRHQDVQGKKDTQGLLNNVIEETATKLAEKRKSKVKALVGAFETVISLQENKPSVTSSA